MQCFNPFVICFLFFVRVCHTWCWAMIFLNTVCDHMVPFCKFV
jgi:hypothetical protein